MKVACEKCRARFKIDNSKIPDQGLSMGCPKCGEMLVVKRKDSDVLTEETAAEQAMTPPPAPPEPSFGELDDDSDFDFSDNNLSDAQAKPTSQNPPQTNTDNLADDGIDFSLDDALADLDDGLELDGDLVLEDQQDDLPVVPDQNQTPVPDLDSIEEVTFDGALTDDLPDTNAGLMDEEDPFAMDVPSLLENAASELEKELGLDDPFADDPPASLPDSNLPDQGVSFDEMLGDSDFPEIDTTKTDTVATDNTATDSAGADAAFESTEDDFSLGDMIDESTAISGNALPNLDESLFGDMDTPTAEAQDSTSQDSATTSLADNFPDMSSDDEDLVTLYRVKRTNGKIFGPFPIDTIKEMIREGKLQGTEEICLSTEKEWAAIGENDLFADSVKNTDTSTQLDPFITKEAPKKLDDEKKKIEKESKNRLRSGSLDVVSPMKTRKVVFKARTIIPLLIIMVLASAYFYLEFIEEISVVDLITGDGLGDKPLKEQLKSRHKKLYSSAEQEIDKDNFIGFTKAREILLNMLKIDEFRGIAAVWALLAQVDYQILLRYGVSKDIFAEADDLMTKLEQVNKEDSEIMFSKASQMMYKKEFSEAKTLLGKVIVMQPTSIKALHMLAENILYLPSKSEANTYLDKIIDYNEASARTYYLKGRYFVLVNNAKQAKKSFTKALELDPAHLDSQIELAGLMAEQDDTLDNAERQLQIIRNTFKDKMSRKQFAHVHYYSAKIFMARNKPYKVVKELAAAIDNESDNYQYNLLLGQFYMTQHNYEKAQSQFANCIQNNPSAIRCRLDFAKSLLILGRADQALFKLEEAQKLDAKNAEIYFLLGDVYEELFKPDKSLEMYEKAIKADPNGVEYYTSAAMSHLKRDNLTKAGEYIQKAKLINANSPLVHNFLGQMHSHQNDQDKAIEEFKKAIKSDKKNIPSHFHLANTYRKIDKFEDAIQEYEEVLNLDDKSDAAYFGLGVTYYKTGENDKAISELEKALNLNSRRYDYYYYAGLAYYRKGDLEKSKSVMDKAMSLAPNQAGPRFYLGRLYMDFNKYDKSSEMLEMAIQLDPKNAEHRFYYAWLLEKEKKYDDALDTYDKALALNNDYAEAYLRKGITLRSQNKFRKAIKMFIAAQKADESIPMASAELGDCYLELRKYKLAIKQYKIAIEKMPEDAVAYNKLGHVYQVIGKQKEAIKYLKHAIEFNPDDPQPHLGLGYSLKALKRKSSAIASFKRYLELNPTAIDREEVEAEIYWLKKR